jgi:hypothetical protein
MLDRIKEYENYFKLVKDKDIADSAAWYLVQHNEMQREILTRNEWKVMDSADGMQLCAEHDKNRPPPFKAMIVNPFDRFFRIAQQVGYKDINALDDEEVKKDLQSKKIAPASTDTSLIIRHLTFTPGPTADDVALNDRSSKGCEKVPISSFDKAMTDEEWSKILKQSKAWGQIINQRRNDLDGLVEQLNLERAKVAYATEALSAVDETLKSLAAIRRSFP